MRPAPAGAGQNKWGHPVNDFYAEKKGDDMIEQKKNEARIEYLTRVLYHYMNNSAAGEAIIDYDGVTCDGLCLANDFADELGLDMEDE